MQRPRDGRGGHRQHVDDLPQGLQPLLHLDAEPLLLVDHHQPEVVEPHVGLGQPVRADDDVDRAFFEPADDLGLLPPRGEPRQRGDLEGKLGHPGGERPQVLLAQQRGGHEHGHLVAGVDRLERRPHRQFGLSVAHVAAEQPVHRPRKAHVALDGVDGDQLVGGFVVGERGVELPLPFGVGGKGDAGPRGPGGLQFEHVGGHVVDGLLDALFLLFPRAGRRAWPAWAGSSPRRRIFAPGRSSSPARRASCGRENSNSRCSSTWPFFSKQLQPAVSGDAVADVDHQVALAQFEEAVDHPRKPPLGRAAQVGPAEQLAAAEQHDPIRHQPETVLQRADAGNAGGLPGRPASRRRCRPAGGPRPRSGRRRTPLGPPRLRPIRRGRG